MFRPNSLDEADHIRIRCFQAAVIGLGDADDDVDDSGEAATAPPAFFHRMINLNRYDQPPRIIIEEADNGLLDFALGDDVAVADNH